MPDFNSDEGGALLFDGFGKVIDAIRYSDDMHFPLLSETRGVSLERLSVNEKNDKENNWHSAAGTAGYGTPGFRNSQSDVDIGGVGISVGEVFSPDNDGFDDVLTVHYSFPQPGTVLSLNVFDYDGRPVRTLLEGETVASDGDIVWNGLTDDRAIANTGIYVLIARSFELGKSEKVIRKAVYLTKQF
jgi:hypothetical protein